MKLPASLSSLQQNQHFKKSALVVILVLSLAFVLFFSDGILELFFDSSHENLRNKKLIIPPLPPLRPPPAAKVAIACLLTSNSKRGETLHKAIDSMAVLRRSVLNVMKTMNSATTAAADTKKSQQQQQQQQQMKNEISFVAILTSGVSREWERVIKQIGWTTVKRYNAAPIKPEEVRNPQIAKEIVKDGAIGIDELIKLNVFEWSFDFDFDVVILLDVDVMFHRPFPELMRPTGKALRWTKGGWASEKINGGFLVIEPKGKIGKKHKQKMLEIVKEGDFRPGTGWRGSGIGWTYGGRTIQGILPFYFLHFLPKIDKETVDSDNLEISRCRYNNMDQLPECKKLPIEKVTSNHFTGDCYKPWVCDPAVTPVRRSERCAGWAKKWNELYAEELKMFGISSASSSSFLGKLFSGSTPKWCVGDRVSLALELKKKLSL